jgi:hypothetical protein
MVNVHWDSRSVIMTLMWVDCKYFNILDSVNILCSFVTLVSSTPDMSK